MMLDVSRRLFLGGAIALTAAATVPLNARLFARTPLIWGDGIHDDLEGLQAALNGEPFKALGDCVTVRNAGGQVLISGGAYRLTQTLIVPEGGIISGGMFKADELLEGPVIHLRGGTMMNFYVECNKRTTYGVKADGPSVLMNGYCDQGYALQ